MSIKFNACPDAHCAIAFLHWPIFHGNRPLNFDMLLPGQLTVRKFLHHACYKLQNEKRWQKRKDNLKIKEKFLAAFWLRIQLKKTNSKSKSKPIEGKSNKLPS